MNILLINKFLFPKGGGAISTLTTGKLLKSHKHNVIFWGMQHPLNKKFPYSKYFVNRVDYNQSSSVIEQLRISSNILYSFETRKKMERLIKEIKPDIAHLNNFAHQISPSILHTLKKYKIPIIMTMRDYKLICASYSMLSGNKVCELCKNGKYYNCFLEGCVKNSKMKSLLNTIEMYLHHKIMHIYDLIDIYVSPSLFLKNKLNELGFKKEILYLPNFVNLNEFQQMTDHPKGPIIYFGRLSKEKGLVTLIMALKGLNLEAKIIGTGPIEEELKLLLKNEKITNVRLSGFMINQQLKDEVRKCSFVVQPSEWYENNPRSVIESFALGKPVIGSRIGGIPELVKDGVTGLTFEPRNVEDLRAKIKYMLSNPDKVIEMGKNTRKLVEEEYYAENHYQKLMEIYNKAINESSKNSQ